MKKLITISALLLIVGNILTECWSWLPNSWMDSEFDLFLKPGFHLKVTTAWYVKELMDDLNIITVFFVFAIISSRISPNLFYIVCVFFFYHVVDAFFLIWDFKQTTEMYWVLLAASIVSIYFLLRKHEMKSVK
jgi:hypothetical protein